MPQVDIDGLNARIYVNELRSSSTTKIEIPASTTLDVKHACVENVEVTNLTGAIVVPAGASLTVADSSGLKIGEAEVKAGGAKSWEDKSVAFTAEAGKSYLVDTSSSAFDATLPAEPLHGDTVIFLDLAGTFETNNLTILGNGLKLQRVVGQDLLLEDDNAYIELVYSGAANGWLVGSTNSAL